MTDEAKALVEELRLWRLQSTDEIADLIETQAREIERLRGALANLANGINIVGSPYHKAQEALDQIVVDTKRAARAALAGDSHDQ